MARIIVCWFLVFSFHVSASNIYIDYFHGDDQNPGSSWSNAKRTFTSALGIAKSTDIIHVTAGHFTESMELISGIQILGGYPPGGGDRNSQLHITELDGSNTNQIMTGASGVVLDGLTFKNGYAPAGGALIICSLDMVIRSCRFIDNVAYSDDPAGGGAVFIYNCSPVFIECSFLRNKLCSDKPIPGLYMTGGAIMCWTSSPVFIRCSFYQNQIENPNDMFLALGGTFFCINSCPCFSECFFQGNNAKYGGALGWWNHSAPIIINCVFDGNSSTNAGGAIASMDANDIFTSQVLGCGFIDNQSVSGGAVAGLQETNIEISNCLFQRNKAQDRGGAIFSVHKSLMQVHGSTIDGNILQGGIVRGGAGIYFADKTEYSISSNIIVNGLYGEGIYLGDADPPGDSRVWNNCVYNNTRGNYGGAMSDQTGIDGNISKNPLFVSCGDNDHFLSHQAAGQDATSPCVDAGDTDFHCVGTTRIDDVRDQIPVDIGHLYNTTYSIPYLDRYYYSRGNDMSLCLLNSGNNLSSGVILYVALQIENDFWFAGLDGQNLYFTEDVIEFSQDYQLDFDTLQELFVLPFPDEQLPAIQAFWHTATVDPDTLELFDYRWTAFELLSK